MFGVDELDHFEGIFAVDDWRQETFLPAASAAEQWLLGFVGLRDPVGSAMIELGNAQLRDMEAKIRLALALAMCIPSGHTVAILSAFEKFTRLPHRYEMEKLVHKLVSHCQSECPISVRKAYQSPMEADLLWNAGIIYGVTNDLVLTDAVAWDDLEALNTILDHHSGSPKALVFQAMARFPADPTSRIHHAFVKNDEDQKCLFHAQLVALKSQISGRFTGGFEHARPTGEEYPTLTPGRGLTPRNNVWLSAPEPGEVIAFHKQSGFAEGIRQDTQKAITEVFRYQGDGLDIDSANWQVVDEITQAFLDAGVPPSDLVTHARLFDQKADPLFFLDDALDKLGRMNNANRRFYTVMFKAYLEEIGSEQILARCSDANVLVAAYQVTGDKTNLQAGNEKVRDRAMGSDLGL